MESKIIALFLVALIGGLGGGYALGYVTYQPQITDLRDTVNHLQDITVPNLQDDLVNLDDRLETANSTFQNKLDTLNSNLLSLNSTVEMMGNTTDHEAYFIEGSGDVTTNTFLIKGDCIRIRWYMLGEYYSWIMIFIYHANGTLYSDRGSSGIFSSYACDLDIEEPNTQYYLVIKTYAVTEYFVTIWDYY